MEDFIKAMVVKSFVDVLKSRPDVAKVERKITPKTIIANEYHFNILIQPKIKFIDINLKVENTNE